jgi:hypothetical protein
MAWAVGMRSRYYRDIETAKAPLTPTDAQAIRYALIHFCAEGRLPFTALPWDVKKTLNAVLRMESVSEVPD